MASTPKFAPTLSDDLHQHVIIVENVRRAFRSPKKEEGLKASLKLLINPQYQTMEALKGVSFKIEQGAFVGLIGANGAGKTTLLKILSGLIPPSSGVARVLGTDPFRRSLAFRKSISLVMGQKAQLWWDLPAVDAFDLLRAIYEIPREVYKTRLQQLADLLDVGKLLSTQIRRLSLGERMKMELIGAILHWPKVIFLDEPTIGLDVVAAQRLRDFLAHHNQVEKATIILTSHNMDDIERLCSRVMILRSGEFIYDGAPKGLMQEGLQTLRVRFKEALTVESLVRETGLSLDLINLSEDDNDDDAGSPLPTFRISAQKTQLIGVLQKILGLHEVVDLGFEEQSLEIVIKRLFESKDAQDTLQGTHEGSGRGTNP